MDMRIAYTLAILKLVFALTIIIAFSFSVKADFIENKGQWPVQVLFATDIPGGKLFIEKERLLYFFCEGSDHAHLSKIDSSKNVSIYKGNSLWAHAYEVKFLNCTTRPVTVGEETSLGTIYNYINGSNSTGWISGARSFKQVRINELYLGIDLVLYSYGSNVKYDLIVHPKGNIKNIRFQYNGLDKIFIEDNNLFLTTHLGEAREMKPYTYQQQKGKQIEVPCFYQLKENILSFTVPSEFDKHQPLVIDPIIIFSAYSGSTSDNWGNTATYDDEGNLYSGGIVASFGYPTTLGAYQLSHAGGSWDIGILKYDSAGSRLVYATYLGGNATETPQSMVVNHAGELLILGTTSSKNFPVSNGSTFSGGKNFEPMDGATYLNGSDIFVAKLNSTGTKLISSTLLGGTNNDGVNFISGEFDTPGMVESPLCRNYGDQFRGDIIIDNDNNVYIASNTTSSNFPIVNTSTLYGGGSHDAVVVKLKPDLSAILWSRFLGGSATDAAYSIKLNEQGDVFVAGGSTSTDFKSINGFKKTNSGGVDGWVARISSNGVDVTAATYIGTSNYDQVYFLDLNNQGEVYLYGQTKGIYPVNGNVFFQANGGQFIHKLSSTLDVSIFSTVFGSGGNSPNISPTAFLVSDCNKLYMAGWGGALNTTTVRIGQGPAGQIITRNFVGGNTKGLRVSSDAYQTTTTGEDFYLMVLDEDASAFLYGTFLGGGKSVTHVDGGTSRFDKRGIVYHAVCAGCGGLSDFPSKNAPTGHSKNLATTGAKCNNAAFKFDLALLRANLRTNSLALDAPGTNTICFPASIVFENLSGGAKYYVWNLGDGTIITTKDTMAITHAYQAPGVYKIQLTAFNNETCSGSDVATTIVSVFDPKVQLVGDSKICYGSSFQLFALGGTTYFWKSEDDTFTSSMPDPIVSPVKATLYRVTIKDESGCKVMDSVLIEVEPPIEYKYSIEKKYDCWNRPSVNLAYTTTANEDDYSFTWDLGDGTISNDNHITHDYAADTAYEITLTASSKTCTYASSQKLNLATVKIPNVITLNGDEKNDRLIVSAESTGLEVYNRWGKLMYKNKDYQNNWPPSTTLPGVYYYLIDIKDEVTCKGWIHVIK